MMRRIFPIVMMLCALPLFGSTEEERVLGRVNEETVTAQDLLDAFTNRHSGHAKFLGGDAEARKFLKIIIDERLFIQEAYNIGLDQDSEVVKLVAEYENAKAADALMKSEIDEKAKPSEDDVKKIWQELNFFLHIRQIAVGTREDAEQIRNAVARGADFETLARTCSTTDSSSHGGHLVVNWGQADPEWERVVFALDIGEVSPVIATRNGFEVVIVDNRIEVQRPEFDKVREQIESTLRERNVEARKRAFSGELFAKYRVELLLDAKPLVVIQQFRSAPETIAARWEGGGTLLLKDALSESEIATFAKASTARAAREIDDRVRATINDALVALEAKARKIELRPDVAKPVQKYRDLVVEQLLFRDHVMKDVKAGDDEIRAYFTANQTKFIAPEERRVAQILLGSMKDAKAVREKIIGGADFGEVAAKFSRDFVTASSGGDLGWITADKVPPAFKDVLTLGRGSLTKPIQTEAGWHVIKVVEIRPKRPLTFDEAKPRAEQRALEQKRSAAQKFWLDKLRAAARIEIDDKAIAAFVAANQFKGDAPPQHALQ